MCDVHESPQRLWLSEGHIKSLGPTVEKNSWAGKSANAGGIVHARRESRERAEVELSDKP